MEIDPMKRVSIFCIGLMAIFSMTSFAADRPTQDSQYRLIKDLISSENSKVRQLGILVEVYAQNHNGSLPTSWSQLDAFTSLNAFGNPPIQDRYALITGAFPSEELGGAQVLIIGDGPSSDNVEKGAGRFIVYRTKSGEYLHGWYSEPKVQKIIAQTHIVVPPLPITPPTSNPQLQPPVTSNNQVQENNTSPQQPAFPDTVSSTSTAPTPPSKPTAEVMPTIGANTPLWIYVVIVLSVGLIGTVWYRSRPK